MKKIDKVIKGVECCILQAENDVYCTQLNCPYYDQVKDSARLTCWTKLNRDVLKLLKEKKSYEIPITEQQAMKALEDSGWTVCNYNCVPFALVKAEVKDVEHY